MDANVTKTTAVATIATSKATATGRPSGDLAMLEFFQDSLRLVDFASAYCVGPEPWVCMYDVLGRIVLHEPDATTYAIASTPNRKEGDHPVTVYAFDHLHSLLDPDWVELAKSATGVADADDGLEVVIREAKLEEMEGYGADLAGLPEVGAEVEMRSCGSDVDIKVARVPLHQPHWPGHAVACVVDQYGSDHWVEDDAGRWVTTAEPN